MRPTPEERYNEKIWSILQRLRESQLEWDQDKIYYEFRGKLWYDSGITENLYLDKLEKWGAIKRYKYDSKQNTVHLKLLPKFSEIYNLYLRTVNSSHGWHSIPPKDSPEIKDALVANRPIFDKNSGKIIIGNKSIEIPFKSVEYYICEAMFEVPFGTKITEGKLQTQFDSEADKSSRIYDAVRRINKKVMSVVSIKRFIKYKASNYWIEWVN